jgi:competence ComEA-like helix-hairpin-helix protein
LTGSCNREVKEMSDKKIAMILGIALFSIALIANGTIVAQTRAQAASKIDVNKATQEQLGKFPGLTTALAKSITEYREKSGPFKTPKDLLKVKGLTNEILNKLNPKLDNGILYISPAYDEEEEEPSLKPSKC